MTWYEENRPTTVSLSLRRQSIDHYPGFGLRVVGSHSPVKCARVLWVAQGGPAHRASLKVGDMVSLISVSFLFLRFSNIRAEFFTK